MTAIAIDNRFSDVELFRMFNIDAGRYLLGTVRELRRAGKRAEAKALMPKVRKAWGRDLWYENKRQRGGVVQDFDAPATLDTPELREARIANLRGFYSGLTDAQLQAKGDEADAVPTPWED